MRKIDPSEAIVAIRERLSSLEGDPEGGSELHRLAVQVMNLAVDLAIADRTSADRFGDDRAGEIGPLELSGYEDLGPCTCRDYGPDCDSCQQGEKMAEDQAEIEALQKGNHCSECGGEIPSGINSDLCEDCFYDKIGEPDVDDDFPIELEYNDIPGVNAPPEIYPQEFDQGY